MALTGRTAQQGGWQSQAEQLAPLTNKTTQGYGWQRQAAQLASTHAALGMAAMTVAGQAQRQPSLKRATPHYLRTVGAEIKSGPEPSKIKLASTLEPPRAKLAVSEQQAARETTSRILSERMETPAAQFATADKGIITPEGELRAASDKLAPQKNEEQWRQTPLDLIVDETLRLSRRLTASDPAATDEGITKLDGIAKLDGGLGSTREELVHWENENRSLQTSLNLLVSENGRLSRCLAEKNAVVAEKRVAELEGELGSARKELVLREEQNHSLKASLALMVSENSRLSRCLTESDAAPVDKRVAELEGELDSLRKELVLQTNENRSLQASLAAANKARSQLEQMKTALIAAEAELHQLASAVNETNQKRQTEISTLHTGLEAMSLRAVTAEKSLADAQQTWLMHIEENSIAECKVSDAIKARKVAEEQLELLQNSLQVKECQVEELEVSRSELVETTNTLLKAFKARDIALARSDERVNMLTERVAQLETDANLAKQKTIDELNSQLQRERIEAGFAEGARKKARMNERQCGTANHVTHDADYEQVPIRSAQLLLADTVTFHNAV